MIEIFTRSASDVLYSRAESFWPTGIRRHRCTDFNYFHGAIDFLWHVIDTAEDIAIICDEDCFIYDWERCRYLLKYLQTSGLVVGLNDGGLIGHRNHEPWFQLNPYFMIIDCKNLRFACGDMLKKDRQRINKLGYHFAIDQYRPSFIDPDFGNDYQPICEPFHGLSCFLVLNGLVTFIPAKEWQDGITTDTGFALHSWYSREYHVSQEQQERIDMVYKAAKNLMWWR